MNFKVGDYVYYTKGKDVYPCQVVQVRNRVKVSHGDLPDHSWSAWVSKYSLSMQPKKGE